MPECKKCVRQKPDQTALPVTDHIFEFRFPYPQALFKKKRPQEFLVKSGCALSSDLGHSWGDQGFAPWPPEASRPAVSACTRGAQWPARGSLRDRGSKRLPHSRHNCWSQSLSWGDKEAERCRQKHRTGLIGPRNRKPRLPAPEGTTRQPLRGSLALPVRQSGLEPRLRPVPAVLTLGKTFFYTSVFSSIKQRCRAYSSFWICLAGFVVPTGRHPPPRQNNNKIKQRWGITCTGYVRLTELLKRKQNTWRGLVRKKPQQMSTIILTNSWVSRAPAPFWGAVSDAWRNKRPECPHFPTWTPAPELSAACSRRPSTPGQHPPWHPTSQRCSLRPCTSEHTRKNKHSGFWCPPLLGDRGKANADVLPEQFLHFRYRAYLLNASTAFVRLFWADLIKWRKKAFSPWNLKRKPEYYPTVTAVVKVLSSTCSGKYFQCPSMLLAPRCPFMTCVLASENGVKMPPGSSSLTMGDHSY